MRTTLTLDDDVAHKLDLEARRTGKPFKVVVNDALRLGLAVQRRTTRLEPFRVTARALGQVRPGSDFTKPEALFDELDGADRLR